MRHRDPIASLHDAIGAAELIGVFMHGRTLDDYVADAMLSSAIERQFEILGGAVNRALQADPSLSENLPEARQVIAFRNRLAHAYDDVSALLVWSYAHEQVPGLLARLRRLGEEKYDA
jgi:uncharacterized protein with HEPN domain